VNPIKPDKRDVRRLAEIHHEAITRPDGCELGGRSRSMATRLLRLVPYQLRLVPYQLRLVPYQLRLVPYRDTSRCL
jgi:hypothetical protein